MQPRNYRIVDPTFAISAQQGQRRIVLIPAGSVVAEIGESDNEMLEVVWNGANLRMFARDLHSRGELFSAQAA